MPDFLPRNQIKIAISSFDDNRNIYIPISTIDEEGDNNERLGDTKSNPVGSNGSGRSPNCLTCCIKVSSETNETAKQCGKDLEGNENTLTAEKTRLLCRTYCFFKKIPLNMNGRIIETGLEVLERNQKFKSQRELEKKKKAYRDKIEDELGQLKKQLDLKIDKIEQKLDQTLSNRASLSVKQKKIKF
jgi:hypothetical protein